MAWPYTFAALAGNVPASYLDTNFAAAAYATDLTALTVVVAALPSSATPQIPVAGGSAGAASSLSRSDHAHPPQGATINLQTGTTYTLSTGDDGKVVELNNASAITVTLPNNLPASFSCLLVQVGAGQVTLSPAGGATMRQRQSLTKTAGQWAQVSAYIRGNIGGASAEYVVGGDMA